MRGLRIVGDYALEFLVVTLLVGISAVSVVFFVPMLVGVTAFFDNEMGTRRFKDIFVAIGANWKILIFYTLFQLVITVFPVLNIYFFNTHPDKMNYFVLAICYVALVVGAFYLTTAPTVIVNMKVNFRQLLYNGIMMLFGSWWRSLAALIIVGGILAMVLLYPYPLILALYLAPFANAKLMKENFLHLKAKALGTTVYELKKKVPDDDYLDERGQVKPWSDDVDVSVVQSQQQEQPTQQEADFSTQTKQTEQLDVNENGEKNEKD